MCCPVVRYGAQGTRSGDDTSQQVQPLCGPCAPQSHAHRQHCTRGPHSALSPSPPRLHTFAPPMPTTRNTSSSRDEASCLLQNDAEAASDPLDSHERPEGLDDAAWLRLLEFRATRAQLEAVRAGRGASAPTAGAVPPRLQTHAASRPNPSHPIRVSSCQDAAASWLCVALLTAQLDELEVEDAELAAQVRE
jgi:hypothetical protein